jgi:hypothetical protein
MNKLLQYECAIGGPASGHLGELGYPGARKRREIATRRTVLMRRSLATAAILLLAAGCSSRKEVSFQRDIQPILQRNCVVCHSPPDGPGYVRSGLILSTYPGLMKGTKLGPVIVPGSSVASTLIRLIQHQADATINMPKEFTVEERLHARLVMPGTKARWLTQDDIERIATWVDQGARNN